MKLRLTILAASIAILPLMASTTASATPPQMGAPVAAASPQESAALVQKLKNEAHSKGLDDNLGFIVATEHPGAAGTRVSRVQHTFKGLTVFGSESVVVSNNSTGAIVSESSSDRAAGLGKGNAGAASASAMASARSAAPSASDIDTTPKLSEAQAIAAAVKNIGVQGVEQTPPRAELMIYPVMKSMRVASALNKSEAALNALDLEEVIDRYELAYLVKTRMLSGGKLYYYDSIVNAKTGAVIKNWSALHNVAGTGNSQYSGQVPLNTTLSNGNYLLKDPNRGKGGVFGAMAITNANHGTSDAIPGNVYSKTSNSWGDGQQYIKGGSTTNANGETAAVNAMWGLMNTYDTHKNVLGWSSLDGNDTSTYIAVHFGTELDNAFYFNECRCMFIGDGNIYNNLGAVDIIGHEMGHGIIHATSALIYADESGGLNESSADITGEMVEAYTRAGGTGATIPNAGNDWMIGKEMGKNGNPLRWMYKPNKDNNSPNAWYGGIGNSDPHLSSGPNNRMFYFLAQGSNSTTSSDYYSSYLNKSPLAMTGIGNDKAYRIWFKAATTKFTSATNYADARNKVLASAEELYGVGSVEAIAVKRAYAAINVGTDVDEVGGVGPVKITTQPSSITVATGTTASFTFGATGGKAPYVYKWFRNGAVISGATSSSYSFTAQTADNGAVFKASVTDSSSPAVTATTGNATLTVGGGTGTSTERIVNGGFEAGTTGWGGTNGPIGSHAGQVAYEGTKFAWLGGNGKTADELLTQSVAIPAAATSASLSFALHIDTAETDNTVYDKLVVTVKNSTGVVLGTLATYSNVNKAAGYQIRTFDLIGYKGQTVQLSFAATEDAGLQTSFVIDKVSLLTR
ncbi:M4 family metallopeptidase [Janthinobacterium lividum]|uniref:M4 family metallopeptidase n=1 Tax=Janthinobacterium lividum TaxID=29581 RepID=UPI000874A91C|nr:M4 family metallopeptidase [Janthinobacterium lividum]MCC7717403.1 M4 family metallopeptidase [Janthinobacterium lividum]OEZ48673.1 transglutaminase-activating metalloprotease precursor [Janthinobacterium lividum]WQE31956.1 M4 family metallopeptidase [Janthinobacterium lividum]STS86228.1 Bacillolysin precursor [Janthinobacterium lividum]